MRFLPLALLFFVPLTLSAATREQEYQQVRAIAMRDPKVRAAYAEADRKLEAKILQIDPALKGYTSGSRPTPAKPASSGRSHKVLAGQTLTSIAGIYGVTPQSIKSLNHIADERKLLVGQTLAIPPRVR